MGADELQAVLAWSSLPFVGERTLRAVLDYARQSRRPLSELWRSPPADLAAFLRLHPRTVAALETQSGDRWTQAAADAAEIRASGVDVLLDTEPDCPPAIRQANERSRRSWPLVFAYGAIGLLEEPRVALVSSRSPSAASLAVTDALADALARRDIALVTSTNREAYQAAATAAKRHAGPSVFVLDRGIGDAFPHGLDREPVAASRVWDAAFDPDLQLLLTPFGWRDHWTARSGPRRDALLFDLADAVVAVDVAAGGTMDRECRELGEGRRLLVLDRGLDTPEATSRLWQEVPGATRIPWKGGDSAAQTVLEALPGAGIPGASQLAGSERVADGWQREIAQFLTRACQALEGERGGSAGTRAVVAYPAAGPFATTARQWSRSENASAGADWLLASLAGADAASPARLPPLLDRLAPGGLLAATVPVEWLEQDRWSGERGAWLSRAALRVVARLPQPPHGTQRPTAALILQRAPGPAVGSRPAPAGDPPQVFAPRQQRMGRFHLRRYLQEVLSALR